MEATQHYPVPRVRVAQTAEDDAKIDSPSTQMLLAMGALGKPLYEGTVPAAVVAVRRRRNKAARKARRIGRS